MRIVREGPRPGCDAFGAILGAAIVAGGALSAAWFRFGLPLPVCSFREWTGLPCATCGSTRMVEALLHGRILEAAAWNPLVFCGVALLCSWGALSATRLTFGLPAWRLVVDPGERRACGLLVVATVAADWIYLVWRGV